MLRVLLRSPGRARFGLRSPKGVTELAAEAPWLALFGSLFVLWALSPSARPSGGWADFSPGCAFIGKGGVVCDAAAASRANVTERSEAACVSYGKGGRYCRPEPANGAGLN